MERAIASKVQTQHDLLKSQLAAALRAIDDDSGVSATQRIERLVRSLELHLTLEENHYFPQQRSGGPGCDPAIDELLLDHADLRSCLRDAVDGVAAGDASAAKAALNRYGEKFQQHEQRESELFEEAEPTG